MLAPRSGDGTKLEIRIKEGTYIQLSGPQFETPHEVAMCRKMCIRDRTSGVLMHISSLPSPYGIGTMGKEARKFVPPTIYMCYLIF